MTLEVRQVRLALISPPGTPKRSTGTFTVARYSSLVPEPMLAGAS